MDDKKYKWTRRIAYSELGIILVLFHSSEK